MNTPNTFIKIPANKNSTGKRKLVCGVGTNDAHYITSTITNNKAQICPYYAVWKSMLVRCYNRKYHTKQPTYIGCEVYKPWLTFSIFKAWMETQDYQGKALDKDILTPGNKVYSPEYCVFVSQAINSLLIDRQSLRGKYPIGVSRQSAGYGYISRFSLKGKTKHIGYYDTPEEAHQAYRVFKSNYIREIADTQPEPIRSGLYRHADLV